MNDTSTQPAAGADAQELRGDTDVAIDFLRRWPTQMMHLFASHTDPRTGAKGKVEGASFVKTDAGYAAAWKWIEARQGLANLYFHVNDLLDNPKNKHAGKNEVARLVGPHVDIDPRKMDDGDDPIAHLAAERTRILGLLDSHSPRPSVVLFSGNGGQGFWPLAREDRIEINGDEAKAIDVERYNIQLERELDGDNCHDVSRIMRVPGTWNIPDVKKRKRGCVLVLAELIRFEDTRFPLSAFKQASRVEEKKSSAAGGGPLPKDLPPVDVDALDLSGLSDAERTKTLSVIHNGPTHEYPFDGDRSDAVNFVCCSLIRADIPDAQIISIIIDRKNKISDHIYAARPRDPRGYAVRQLERALEQQPRPGPIVSRFLHPKRARVLRDARFPNLKHWTKSFWDYGGGRYFLADDSDIKASTWLFLERCRAWSGKPPELLPLAPSPELVGATISALQAVTNLSRRDVAAQPCWLDPRDDDPDLSDVISFPNGILNVATGKFMAPGDPRLFTVGAVAFDYNESAGAEPVEWLKFLGEILEGDEQDEQIRLVQEIFGYCLTSDISQEKVFFFYGDKRSGKGTMKATLQALMAPGSVAGPTLKSLPETFGLQPLIGKQLAVIDDIRLTGKTDEGILAEYILKIAGRGLFTINRKHIGAVDCDLPIKFIIISNGLPSIADNASALASRFITVKTRVSFYGREKPHLFKHVLRPELPAILNWSLIGLRRLRDQGHFSETKVSAETRQQLAELGSPVQRFIAEQCVLGPEQEVVKYKLFKQWTTWREANNHQECRDSGKFGAALMEAYRSIRGDIRHRTGPGGKQETYYSGIGLPAEWNGEQYDAF